MIVGLGGRSDHIATVPNADPVRLRMTPEETQLFACVGRVARIGEVLERSGLPEAQAIAALLSLRAKGAIAPARVQKSETRTTNVDAALLENVDLDEEKKREILELEKNLDRVDFFTLLQVPAGSEPSEVKKAYYEASRRYHPDRYFGKNLGSYRARVERIFRTFTEAHETLTQPARRKEYLAKHPELNVKPAAPPRAFTPSSTPASLFDDLPPTDTRSPENPARVEERRARFARHPYLARAHKVSDLLTQAKSLADGGDFEKAMAELSLVTQLDPKNREAPQLLSALKRKNDRQRAAKAIEDAKQAEQAMDTAAALHHYRRAVSLDDDNAELAFRTARLLRSSGGDVKEARTLAQRAVELAPRNAEHHHLLGLLVLEAGLKKVAKRHFEEVLKLNPEHAEAKAQLKKLRWTF